MLPEAMNVLKKNGIASWGNSMTQWRRESNSIKLKV